MKKWKNMKKLNKLMTIFLIILVSGVVVGTLIDYFGTINTTITTKTSLFIDGYDYTETIHDIFTLHKGDKTIITHVFSNLATECNVSVNMNITGLVVGVTVTFKTLHDGALTFPFILHAGENKTINFIYKTKINLKENLVDISMIFDATEINAEI